MEKKKTNIPGLNIAFTIIIITEIMFFAGLVSAYIIAASKAMDWPPVDQPRLAPAISLSNMLILLLSAVVMYFFIKNSKKGIKNIALLGITILLGVIFLIIQGSEWINLINFGIQTSEGLYASYFYSIIAVHGVHVLAGLLLLVILYFKIYKADNISDKLTLITSFGMFWYFVSLLWPVLYFLLYLY